MLVHICCSVDSHYFLQEMQKLYPNTPLTGFFYNPNIHPKEEYDLRLLDVKRSCAALKIPLLEGDYTLKSWMQAIKGLEQEPEKGKRCSACFDARLEVSARMALMLGLKQFSTTLLSSPMKEQAVLKEQGEAIAKKYSLEFIYTNVRVCGGVEKQNALAKKDKLYRQNYCGCVFALEKQRQVQNKPCIELISPLNRQMHPASVASRLELFKKRQELESQAQNYHLLQQNLQTYLLLRGWLCVNQHTIASHILTHSNPKKVKIKDLQIAKIPLKPTLAEEMLCARLGVKAPKISITLGFSPKDDSLFIDIKSVSLLLNTPPTPLKDLRLTYEQELYLREKIAGVESVQAIFIVQDLNALVGGVLEVEIYSKVFEQKNFYLLATS
ncbi:FIG053235: Diacylglucosamine hydrolase like [Helicobacter heilmannii]|uniref:epoxyqueuosine reductase QueH n=1 Tax=Helicobacter heilmannii TaxID=35817 RepID=UPI0006A1A41E|nr:epoxyqueuosine reductase QueH [Helicobacter heilmannii]CRF51380.1 FIG053235: Diacylglucosamine hydrolase like [Helicobacter heilmannii]